jgi:hypothetical protein
MLNIFVEVMEWYFNFKPEPTVTCEPEECANPFFMSTISAIGGVLVGLVSSKLMFYNVQKHDVSTESDLSMLHRLQPEDIDTLGSDDEESNEEFNQEDVQFIECDLR